MGFSKFVSVVLDFAIDRVLDYGVGKDLEGSVVEGVRVRVPLRGKVVYGYVVAVKGSTNCRKVSPVIELESLEVFLSTKTLSLARWMSSYYCAPMSRVVKVLIPMGVRKKSLCRGKIFVTLGASKEKVRQECVRLRSKGRIQCAILDVMLKAGREISSSELLQTCGGSMATLKALAAKKLLKIDVRADICDLLEKVPIFRSVPKDLNEEQGEALCSILKTMNSSSFGVHLLHGVTGSGKTEVYLQSIEYAIEKNLGGVIVLVPEISLTGQTIDRFRARLGVPIGVIHSKISVVERSELWGRIRRGEVSVVVGVRSAIFAPVENLALVIVDEEHDSSYKHGQSPYYNARHVAVMKGKVWGSAVILGSATPSLESRYNCDIGVYSLSTISRRVNDAKLPAVTVVDMEKERRENGSYIFSRILVDKVLGCKGRGEQAILFINRRGYRTSAACLRCGNVVECPHCSVSLTFHKVLQQLVCHTCGFSQMPLMQCGKCGGEIKFRGFGTELVEKALHAAVPGVTAVRIDADVKNSAELLRNFKNGRWGVMIGTQMISKGLHFPMVSLVAVLNADCGAGIPDIFSSENIFQLIVQVGGRAGRGDIPGELLIQTRDPDNAVINMAARGEYEKFYRHELSSRRYFDHPPFSVFVRVIFAGEDLDAVRKCGDGLYQLLAEGVGKEAFVLPLMPCGHAKIKNKYRMHFMVSGKDVVQINRSIMKAKSAMKPSRKVSVAVDVHPASTFF